MIKNRERKYWNKQTGFTLIEVLSGMTIAAVLLASLYSVFAGVMNLREKTFQDVESRLPRSYVSDILARDLRNMAAPGGELAGNILGNKEESQGYRMDTLEFYSRSGIISDDEPWAEIQKVEYYLAEPEDDNEEVESGGMVFLRAITRNLLATVMEEPDEKRFLSGVQSLEISYYDGNSWLDSWDSTTSENKTPEAVKFNISFVESAADENDKDPMILLYPVTAQTVSSEGNDNEDQE